jgi:hypothetical protein
MAQSTRASGDINHVAGTCTDASHVAMTASDKSWERGTYRLRLWQIAIATEDGTLQGTVDIRTCRRCRHGVSRTLRHRPGLLARAVYSARVLVDAVRDNVSFFLGLEST